MDPLSHEHILLRALEPEDLEVLYRWENDPSIWHLSGTMAPFSRYVLKKYLEQAGRDLFEMRQLRLIIEQKAEERPVGAIDLFDLDPYHRRAGIGILIARKDDRGRGFAREALSCLMDYAFGVLHLHQLWCNIAEGNEPSIKLFRAAGFQPVGKKREWLFNGTGYESEWLYQCLASGYESRSGAAPGSGDSSREA